MKTKKTDVEMAPCTAVFLNRRATARYQALASIIPGRERPEETTVCYKISFVQWLITNLNVILYLSICHNLYISVLIFFMIMPSLIINAYVSLMYEFKKIEKVFTSKYVGTGPSSCKKRICQVAVSQSLRNTAAQNSPLGLFNGSILCSLCVTSWFFICNGI